ncbi:inactive peptidyl-prolyl cis-trans isomerase FKBP6 isoform X3 [Passer domesticus]|uniref:inactive peptidyl-prolyl cis-trans isomerase FKBP6 isoform X3 n=1 Tax=Passer domesticus TaxID=48849 RepID=UPI0030FE1AC7
MGWWGFAADFGDVHAALKHSKECPALERGVCSRKGICSEKERSALGSSELYMGVKDTQNSLYKAVSQQPGHGFETVPEPSGVMDQSLQHDQLQGHLDPGTVKYSGYLGNWNKLFCSNGNSKYPRLMKLGKDITVWGLEIGLLSMTKGEAALFVLTPEYAYGQRGCPPSIPPNTTVLFKVEVLDFIDSEECDAFFELTYEQRERLPLEKVLKVAATEREFGNYFFYKQRFKIAKDRYKRACLYMREYSKSRDFLARAQCIQPFNRDINNELKKLARYYKEYMEMEKEMCCQMFDPLNSYG